MDINGLIANFKNRFLPQKKDRNKLSIGLDWGFSSLKLVVLEIDADTYTLKDARIMQIPSQLQGLKLNEGLDFSPGVNLGICGPNVIVRYVAMAKMTEEEFKASLRYEAASHLPFPLEEVNFDGVILKELADNKMLVMFVAARKDFIYKRLKLFQDAGIKVNVLDIDSLALINAFNHFYLNTVQSKDDNDVSKSSEPQEKKNSLSKAVALLNIGASVTNINILEEGVPYLSRDIYTAGKDLMEKKLRDVAVVNFVTEIRKSFDYYEAGTTTAINEIFLSGGGSLSPYLKEEIHNFLGITVTPWDVFSHFNFSPGLDEENIRKNSAQFAVAVGLALR